MDFGDGNKAPGKKRRAEDDAPPAVSEIDGNTVCKAATHLITRETKECVVAWFTAVDTDCSGCLEEKDIHGYQLPSGVLLWDTIKSADLDGDGKISLLEFETTLIKFVLTSRCLSEASLRPPLPLPLCFRALLFCGCRWLTRRLCFPRARHRSWRATWITPQIWREKLTWMCVE
jgi:hypothetical protein